MYFTILVTLSLFNLTTKHEALKVQIMTLWLVFGVNKVLTCVVCKNSSNWNMDMNYETLDEWTGNMGNFFQVI